MSRQSDSRFVKPMLETLEARDQPSFILSGGVQSQLQPPVDNMLKDMNAAASDLGNQIKIITTDNKTAAGPNVLTTGALTPAQAQGAFGKAVGDYQRIWNDFAAIQTTVAADTAFVNAVAMAELTEGDPIDLILLRFGGIFKIDPLAGLNNDLTQATSLWNNGQLTNGGANGNLTTGINEDFSKLLFPNTTVPSNGFYIATGQSILGSAQKPTFAT